MSREGNCATRGYHMYIFMCTYLCQFICTTLLLFIVPLILILPLLVRQTRDGNEANSFSCMNMSVCELSELSHSNREARHVNCEGLHQLQNIFDKDVDLHSMKCTIFNTHSRCDVQVTNEFLLHTSAKPLVLPKRLGRSPSQGGHF